MVLKVLPHQLKHLQNHSIAQGIENLISFLAGSHNLATPQNREVLREIGLLHAETFLNGAGGNLSIAERFQYGDAGGMS